MARGWPSRSALLAVAAVAAAGAAGGAAAAETVPTGWYTQDVGTTGGVRIHVDGRRIRIAQITDLGRGVCVGARGRRRASNDVGVYLKPLVGVLGPDGGFTVTRAQRERDGDSSRVTVRGRVSGGRIVGTVRNQRFWSAVGRGPDFPERCTGTARFTAKLTWAQDATYAGTTAQGLPIEIRTHVAPSDVGNGTYVTGESLREVRIRSLRISTTLLCESGDVLQRTVRMDARVLGRIEGFGEGVSPFEGDVRATIDGLRASGTFVASDVLITENYDEWECSSRRVAFTAAYVPPAPG